MTADARGSELSSDDAGAAPDGDDRPLAILTALGSRGDVNPMLGMAVALRRSGIEPLVVLAEPYQPLAEALGIRSLVAISSESFERHVHDPRMWRPILGVRKIIGEMVPEALPRLYHILETHYRPGRTVLVAHPLDFASRTFRDAHPEAPLASVHLAPVGLRTYHDPPHMTAGVFNVRRPAWLVRSICWSVDATLVRRWLARPLNDFRRSIGLPPVARPLDQWWLSPDRVLGLFPDWFAPADLPPVMRCCGFPRFDGPEGSDADAARRVLASAEAPPVVFTAGSAHATATPFFRAAVDAAVALETPAILLAAHRDQIPRDLPPGIQWVPYVALGNLLAGCRAIVHHGGIGTTSQALAAGVPQLLCPMAFDQFDNAARVVRLGCGLSLPMGRVTSGRLEERLRRLLDDPAFGLAARHQRQHVAPEQQVWGCVVDEIGKLLGV